VSRSQGGNRRDNLKPSLSARLNVNAPETEASPFSGGREREREREIADSPRRELYGVACPGRVAYGDVRARFCPFLHVYLFSPTTIEGYF